MRLDVSHLVMPSWAGSLSLTSLDPCCNCPFQVSGVKLNLGTNPILFESDQIKFVGAKLYQTYIYQVENLWVTETKT
jgi:hypothetical protein